MSQDFRNVHASVENLVPEPAKAGLRVLFGNKVLAFFSSIGFAVGVIVSIAMGFYVTYKAITLIGN